MDIAYNLNDIVNPQKVPSVDKNKMQILMFINCVYGSYFKVKEIHFNTKNQAAHSLSDEVSGTLIEFADRLFENFMGVYERCGFNILEPHIPDTEDLKKILIVLRSKMNKLTSAITEDSELQGLVNVLNDYQETFNKYIYLSDNR